MAATRTGFDASFAALSDATRRGVLEQLGRVRTCRLGLRRLEEEARHPAAPEPVEFFGRYLEVTPHARCWS